MKNQRKKWKWANKEKTQIDLWHGENKIVTIRHLSLEEEQEARASDLFSGPAPIWRWERIGTDRWGMSTILSECQRVSKGVK